MENNFAVSYKLNIRVPRWLRQLTNSWFRLRSRSQVMGLSSVSSSVLSIETASDSFSLSLFLSLSLPLPLLLFPTCMHSLSKKKQKTKKKVKYITTSWPILSQVFLYSREIKSDVYIKTYTWMSIEALLVKKKKRKEKKKSATGNNPNVHKQVTE